MDVIKVDIEEAYEEAVKLADERKLVKGWYNNNNAFTDDFWTIGILGELVFSMVTQMPAETKILQGGDGGFDFPGINVKTSEENKAKYLIEFVDKEFKGYYVFVIVNLKEKYGYIKGYIHSDKFKQKAKIKDFGHGMRLALPLEELHPYRYKKPLKLKIPVA